MLNIPKKLFLEVLDNLSNDAVLYNYYFSNSGKPLVEIPMVSTKSSNFSQRRRQFINRTKTIARELKTTYKDLYIDNEFKVRVNFNHTMYRCYSPQVIIELVNDNFKDFNYQPYIVISYYRFLEMLKQCDGILNGGGELPGTWKLVTHSTGHYYNYSFISADKNNISNSDKLSILLGENHFKCGKTTKWVPGHLYYSGSQLLVYLGDVDNVPLNRYYHRYSTTAISIFDVGDGKEKLSGKLVLDLTNNDRLNLVNSKYKNTTVDLFKVFIDIQRHYPTNYWIAYSPISCIGTTSVKPSAVDLGEFFKLQNTGNELLNEFTDKLSSNIESFVEICDDKNSIIYILNYLNTRRGDIFEFFEESFIELQSKCFYTFIDCCADCIGKDRSFLSGKEILDYLKDKKFDENSLILSKWQQYKVNNFKKHLNILKSYLDGEITIIGKLNEEKIAKILN